MINIVLRDVDGTLLDFALRKEERSGLAELMDGVFLSEKLGFEKPDIQVY